MLTDVSQKRVAQERCRIRWSSIGVLSAVGLISVAIWWLWVSHSMGKEWFRQRDYWRERGFIAYPNVKHGIVLIANHQGIPNVTDIPSDIDVDELWLENTNVDDRMIHQLGRFRRIRLLSISFADVSDDGLESLRSVRGLQELRLYRTMVTPEGMRRFESARPDIQVQYAPRRAVGK